jgi:hypothetical protein
MCSNAFCGEDTFNRAMGDAYNAGQENAIYAVSEALKEYLDPKTIEQLKTNARPDMFAHAVADLISLATIDDRHLSKWGAHRKNWKMGFWSGRRRERDFTLKVIHDYTHNWGNLLLGDTLRAFNEILELLEKEPIKTHNG